MHDHTTKAVATLESEAPLIKAVDTLEAETILTKAVVATLEHVGTLDVMRVAIGEESNGAITRPGEDQVPTTGDTLDCDGGRDGVAEVPTCTASLILHRLLSCSALSCTERPIPRSQANLRCQPAYTYGCASGSAPCSSALYPRLLIAPPLIRPGTSRYLTCQPMLALHRLSYPAPPGSS